MKKWLFLMLVLAMTAGAGDLEAAIFTETFLGGDDFLTLGPDGQANFNFDLTAPGNLSSYSGTFLLLGFERPFSPTTDENLFRPAEYIVTAGTLFLTFASRDYCSEEVEIYSGSNSSEPFEQINFDERELGDGLVGDLLELNWLTKETKAIRIDLGASGLLDDLQDGLFLAQVFAPNKNGILGNILGGNDIRIEEASLVLEASQVPVPTALVLLGSGILGLITWRRR